MKKLYTLFIGLLWVLALSAQIDCPVDTINGEPLYRYTVQKGEGLYRVSQLFGVSQDEIIRYNPTLKTNGLKLGQVLHLPIVAVVVDSTQYVVHTIQKGETIYSLSRRYNVKEEQLRKLNPKTSVNMPIGATLLIKRKEETARATVEANVKDKLQKPEVHVAKTDTVITKSKKKAAKEIAKEKKVLPIKDNVVVDSVVSTIAEEHVVDTLQAEFGLPIRLAYMLPICADALEREAAMDKFLRFYEGALLAINELQAEGQRFEIYVYDIGKSEIKVHQVLEQPELKTVDAIIGPAYQMQVVIASLFAKAQKIPCFVPFTNRVSNLEGNAYIFQLNPSVEDGKKAIIMKEETPEWAVFDAKFRSYFGNQNQHSQSLRYDLLGYDFTHYIVTALKAAALANDAGEQQVAYETPYDGLQTTIHFVRQDEGGYMNLPMKVVDR